MGINAKQLRLNVIRPVLQDINLWSESAENLLLGTAAQESHMGTYLKQINGPALGIYQMEPATHKDLWLNYLNYQPELKSAVLSYLSHKDESSAPAELVFNLAYATLMSRIHYRRVKEVLPQADDLQGLGRYWKKYYNTELGKGTVEEFVRNYTNFVLKG